MVIVFGLLPNDALNPGIPDRKEVYQVVFPRRFLQHQHLLYEKQSRARLSISTVFLTFGISYNHVGLHRLSR